MFKKRNLSKSTKEITFAVSVDSGIEKGLVYSRQQCEISVFNRIFSDINDFHNCAQQVRLKNMQEGDI